MFSLSMLNQQVHLQHCITRLNHWLLLSCKSRESESERFAEIQRCNADEASADSQCIKLSLLAENVSIDHWSSQWNIDYILLDNVERKSCSWDSAEWHHHHELEARQFITIADLAYWLNLIYNCWSAWRYWQLKIHFWRWKSVEWYQ